jgi:diguanylate cyclase (GGDEF)-like protein
VAEAVWGARQVAEVNAWISWEEKMAAEKDIWANGLLPLIEQSIEGIILIEPSPWRVVYVNQAAANWLAVSIDNVIGRPFQEFIEADARGEVLTQVEAVLRSGDTSAARLRFNGGRAPEVTLFRVTVNGQPLVGIVIHTAPRRQDPVTGLPDRDFLMSRLAELLCSKHAEDRRFAVLFVDVNNFKEVNDRHGHLVGDSVLREAAQRLSQCLPEAGHVVRFGGDEFVILLERVAGTKEIRSVIVQIELAVAQPIAVPDGEVSLSLSVGVAMSSNEYRTPEELLSAADQAMYASKRGSQ